MASNIHLPFFLLGLGLGWNVFSYAVVWLAWLKVALGLVPPHLPLHSSWVSSFQGLMFLVGLAGMGVGKQTHIIPLQSLAWN